MLLGFPVDDAALGDAAIQHVHEEQPVLPDGKCGDDSHRQFGVRELASPALAIHVAVASELSHQLSCRAVNHLHAVPAGRIEITFSVQGLVLPRRDAVARPEITWACPM